MECHPRDLSLKVTDSNVNNYKNCQGGKNDS